MRRTILVGSLAALSTTFSTLAQETVTVTVEGTVASAKNASRENPPPVRPLSETVMLSEELPEGVEAPKGLVEPWGGSFQAGSKKIAVVVGKSSADAERPDRLAIDRDGNGKWSEGEILEMTTTAREQRGGEAIMGEPIEGEMKSGAEFRARFAKQGTRPPMVLVEFPSYFVADVEGGQIAILDQDYDGKYGTQGDMWTFAKSGGRMVTAYGMSAMGERVFQDGELIGIAVDGKNVKVTRKEAEGPDPKDAAAHRARVEHLWMDRFDAEREGFITTRGLDTSRPTTEKPIDWKYVTFDEAIALGKEAGKPVFIDVMAFWCVWCYRMDYYTYPDAEVAKMLREDFVPVKIIQEQDLAGDYDRVMKGKLEARGIPAMGIFDAEGEAIHKIGGWKKPEDFIAELKKAKEAYGDR